MNVEKVIGTMFGLILVFLILTRAAEFNAIIKQVSGFVTQQTAQLQGYNTGKYGSPYAGSTATQKLTSSGSGVSLNVASVFS